MLSELICVNMLNHSLARNKLTPCNIKLLAAGVTIFEGTASHWPYLLLLSPILVLLHRYLCDPSWRIFGYLGTHTISTLKSSLVFDTRHCAATDFGLR